MKLERQASCACGALSVTTSGEPVAIGMCHCLDCQRRTGSLFGVQARFLKDQVEVTGSPNSYTRTGDSGRTVTFHFCGACGTTLHWQPEALPDHISVAVGGFADSSFAPPNYSVFETRKHPWLHFQIDMEHYD